MTHPLRNAVRPWAATGDYYVRSWREFATGNRDEPRHRPTLFQASQALGDELALAAFRMLPPTASVADLERIEDELAEASRLYDRRGWSADPTTFHPAPPRLDDADVDIEQVTLLGHRRHQWLRFESGYEPFADEPGRARWLSYRANTSGHAWLLTHEEPRPWLVTVHGAFMGRAATDLLLLRARRLHEKFGLNVVVPVLPLHGPRREGLPAHALLGGVDIVDNVHGAAQGVWDIRRLLSWIGRIDPGSPVGITGISLGGYISSLVASVQDDLACAILGIPASHLRDVLERHTDLPAGSRERLRNLAASAGQVVSPLGMHPKLPWERRFIYAGIADRLVPRADVVTLWRHWDRPAISWYGAGHLGYYYSRRADRFVVDALRTSGLVTDAG